jgi:LmbE family N-acetylglucosaminyl deacetylase
MQIKQDAADIAIFTAHCDDAEVWAGGTIAKICSQGARIDVHIAFSNKIRREEAIRSAAELGHQVFFRSYDISLQEWIGNSLHQSKAEVLLTHPPTDPHIEHREVFHAVEWAHQNSNMRRQYPSRWYLFDSYYLTRSPETIPILLDITETFELKCKAIGIHCSQNTDELTMMVRASNTLHGMKIRCQFAEAFYPFPLLGRWPRLRETL